MSDQNCIDWLEIIQLIPAALSRAFSASAFLRASLVVDLTLALRVAFSASSCLKRSCVFDPAFPLAVKIVKSLSAYSSLMPFFWLGMG